MKQTLTYILFLILVSCNTEQAPVEAADEPAAKTVNENLQAIDSDDALIATALMAAPKEFREGCSVIGSNMKGEFVYSDYTQQRKGSVSPPSAL